MKRIILAAALVFALIAPARAATSSPILRAVVGGSTSGAGLGSVSSGSIPYNSAGTLRGMIVSHGISFNSTTGALTHVDTCLGPFSLTAPGEDVVAGTAVYTFTLHKRFYVNNVYTSVSVAGTTTDVITDFNANGSTILSTKSHIDPATGDSSSSATPAVLSSHVLNAGTVATWDIDSADSGNTAAGMTGDVCGYYMP